jgi:RNA polymerase sigma-70 factor (ECF subfamily)
MRGDLDFERLVEAHYAPLYRFGFSLSRNETDAADLVQDTFYLWATRGHQLADMTKVKSWLFTTLHREFLARRRRALRFSHEELSAVEEELPQMPPPMLERLDWEGVADSLAKLEPAFQAAVTLFYLEDFSYNEIAETLGIPIGTVKSRIARGIAQLQRMFATCASPTPRRPE